MTALAPNGRPLAEVYRAAAGLVRAGWHRLRLISAGPTGPCYCAAGAVLAAAGFDLGRNVPTKTVDEFLLPLAKSCWKEMRATPWATPWLVTVLWNDLAGQTADNVADRLDRVAADLEKGGAT